MSESTTLQGVGRLHRGHRTLGCVGYVLDSKDAPATVVRFDPMPEAAQGDIFHLTLEDGRILECQMLSNRATNCAVIDGPRPERRHQRRPSAAARFI